MQAIHSPKEHHETVLACCVIPPTRLRLRSQAGTSDGGSHSLPHEIFSRIMPRHFMRRASRCLYRAECEFSVVVEQKMIGATPDAIRSSSMRSLPSSVTSGLAEDGDVTRLEIDLHMSNTTNKSLAICGRKLCKLRQEQSIRGWQADMGHPAPGGDCWAKGAETARW
jgi:hypothetical protein